MKKAIWMLAAAFGAAGCGGSMMSDRNWIRSMVDDARQENDAHRVAIDDAGSLAQVRDEMDRHEATMDDMMATMGTGMDGMTHCTGSGMQDLRDMHGDINGEMDQHGAVMDQSTDLDTASAEVTRHAATMDEMVDGMDVASDRMGC